MRLKDEMKRTKCRCCTKRPKTPQAKRCFSEHQPVRPKTKGFLALPDDVCYEVVTGALSVRSIVSSGSFADVQLFVTHFKRLLRRRMGAGWHRH